MWDGFPLLAGSVYPNVQWPESNTGLKAMAGPPARRDSTAIYNCSYLPVDSIDSFCEALLISMAGCGVGYSVESSYVENFPRVQRQRVGEPSFCQLRQSNAPHHRCPDARNALYPFLECLPRLPRVTRSNAFRIRRYPRDTSALGHFCRLGNKCFRGHHQLITEPRPLSCVSFIKGPKHLPALRIGKRRHPRSPS